MIAVTIQAIILHRPRGPEWSAPLSSKLTPQPHHFPGGADDHPGVAAGRLPRFPRVVMHTHLGDPRAMLARAGEYLDVDQRAGAPQLWQQPLDERAPVHLETAVNVAHRDAEEQARHEVVHEGIQPAERGVVPRDAVAADDVGRPEAA